MTTIYKRPQGVSQLDYLWLNFGGKSIASEVSADPSDDVVLSEKAVTALIQQLEGQGSGITSLLYDQDPDHEKTMRLTGKAIDGSIITVVRIPEEEHIVGFVGRTATQADIDNGFTYPINSQVLAITTNLGSEYLVSLEQLNLVVKGSETATVYTEVTNGVISSNVKVDSGNNSLSCVRIKNSNSGIYTQLEVSNTNTGVTLETTGGYLKAKIPIGTSTYNLKVDNLSLADYMNLGTKDPGTLYFITDYPYIYLGSHRYGVNIEPGDAPIVSLVYDADTFTLAYKRSDETDIRLVKLGPVSTSANGMMSKEQYADLVALKTAIDDIVSVKDYVSAQIGTAGFELAWGNTVGKQRELLLKNRNSETISTLMVDKESFLDFAVVKKATTDDVLAAAKTEVSIVEGESIIIFTLTSGDKVYASVNSLVDIYTSKNTKSINTTISNANEISSDLNISNEDKILFIYNDGLGACLQIVRTPGKVTIYGRTQTDADKVGEFNLSDPRIKTIFVASATDQIFTDYPPRQVDGQDYDRLTNPVTVGEPYLIECFGNETDDPSSSFRYNDYISVLPMVNSFTLSPKEGNILERDENGYLYATLNLIDV